MKKTTNPIVYAGKNVVVTEIGNDLPLERRWYAAQVFETGAIDGVHYFDDLTSASVWLGENFAFDTGAYRLTKQPATQAE